MNILFFHANAKEQQSIRLNTNSVNIPLMRSKILTTLQMDDLVNGSAHMNDTGNARV